MGFVKLFELLKQFLHQVFEVLRMNKKARRCSENYQTFLFFQYPGDSKNLGKFPSCPRNHGGDGNLAGQLNKNFQPGFWSALLEYFEKFSNSCVRGPMLGWQVVKHGPASKRDEGRELAQNEAIAREKQSRRCQAQLSICAYARLEFRCPDQSHPRHSFRRPAVEVNGDVVFQRTHRGEQVHDAIKAGGCFKEARWRKYH